MNYVNLNGVRYAAMVLVNADETGQTVGCEHETENGSDVASQLLGSMVTSKPFARSCSS